MNDRVEMFGIQFDALRMEEAVTKIFKWSKSEENSCRYVVTPNVDHIVELQRNTAFKKAYMEAALVLTDGKPISWAAHLFVRPWLETVPGSDLLPALFNAANTQGGLRVFLLGAAPGVATSAAKKIHARWPAITIVGTYSPPFGFEHDEFENTKIIRQIEATKPEVLVIGFGAPKQEIWVNRHAPRINAKTALCLGAAIDFLADEKKRAPLWMRRIGFEWLYRWLTEPKRLSKRYLRDACIFPKIIWNEYNHKKNNNFNVEIAENRKNTNGWIKRNK